MTMTDTPPTKRSSRRRPIQPAPGQEPLTEGSTTPAVGVPPDIATIPIPISAPAATVPEVPTQLPPADSDSPAVAAAPSLPAPPVPAPPIVILREPGAQLPAPAVPVAEPTLPNSPFRRHDVVQVLDMASRHYGQFFMVGDAQNRKVHGYLMTAGGHKEFVTIEQQHCWYIGSAKIRSATPCSPKWISDYNRA